MEVTEVSLLEEALKVHRRTGGKDARCGRRSAEGCCPPLEQLEPTATVQRNRAVAEGFRTLGHDPLVKGVLRNQ